MTEKELAIYDGLLVLAPETAAFFKTGIEIFKIDIEARAYMLAHLAREIEGGLRDILYTKDKSFKCSNCGQDVIENRCLKCNSKIVNGVCPVCISITKLVKCPSCSHPIDGEHLKSILKALGISEKNDFAKRWHSTAKNFHKYAHRHGAEKKPRDKRAFDKLWTDFIEILAELVGNYFSISERVDAIISNKEPSKQIIDSLPNLFIKESIEVYFFKNLKQINWLPFLYEKGFFSGDKNPAPIEIEIKDGTKGLSFPRWVVLDYLLFCAEELRTQGGDFTFILKIIDHISSYKNPDKSRVLNPHTDDTIIRLISQLPNDKIEDKHFVYIDDAIRNPYSFSTLSFEALLKRLINDKDKKNILNCLNILLSYIYVENQIEQYYPVIEISFLMHFREIHGKDIIKICGTTGLGILLKKLEEITLKEHFFDVNTVEDHPQNWNQYKYILQLVFFTRDYLFSCPNEYLLKELSFFASHEKEIFRRLAFYVINIRYNELKNVLWDLKINPLDNLINKHELFELIKNHQKELRTNEQTKILEWIETISYQSFVEEKNYDQILSHSRKEWLLALENVENEHIQAAKAKYSKLFPYSIEHPGFSSWMSSQTGFDSPIYLDEIESKNLQEVIELFSEYEKKNALPLYNFDIQGLSDVIEEDIYKNIEKYTIDLDYISSTSVYFKYVWLMGISRFIERNDVSFNLLDFLFVIYRTIDHSNFWIKSDTPLNQNEWFLNRFLSIMLVLSEKETWRTDIKIRNLTKGILLFIFRRMETDIEDYSDLSHLSLNYSQGKLYEVLIKHMLLSDHLDWDIKAELEFVFKKKSYNPLLLYTLGKYFPLLWVKNKKWINDNVDSIFPKENLPNWKASIEGYHMYVGRVYKDIFLLFKNGHHYDQFINNIELFGHTSSFFIVTHIIIAFDDNIHGFNENDDLYKLLISSNNIVLYQNIINSITRGIRNPKSEKVKVVWRSLWEFCNIADSEAKKYFLQESYRLLDHIPELDENMEQWILSSSQFMNPFQARNFFDILTQFVGKSPEMIGRIVLAFITDKSVAVGSNLGKIVEELYKNGLNQVSDKICNILAEKGNDELSIIYKKFHK